jgi:hypothetical protein
MLNLYVPSHSSLSCLSSLLSRSLLFNGCSDRPWPTEPFGALLMVVTQIFRYLRPHHSWSPHRPPNFPKSNAASIRVHIPSNIRSVGEWLGVVTGDGRSGYADLGTLDKIEKRKWDMHNFWVGLDYQSWDMDVLAVFDIPISFLA